MKKIGRVNEIFISLLIILIVSFITFLPFINQLGFYGDDWIMLWAYITSGSEKVASIYATDRPFTGLVVGQFFKILGTDPLNWQLFIFALRIAGTLLFYWLVRTIWKDQALPTLLMTLIFATYPGFTQTPQALTYQALFLGVNFGLFASVLGILAIQAKRKTKRILLSILSGLFFLGCLLMVEWLIGVAAFFVVLVFFEVRKRENKLRLLILRSLSYALPALAGSAIFLIWRIFFFQNKRIATDIGQLLSNYGIQTASKVFNLIFDTARSFFNTAVLPWFVSFNDLWNWGTKTQVLQIFLIASLVFFIPIIIYWFFRNNKIETKNVNSHDWTVDGIIIGFLGVLLTIIPVTLTGRNISLISTFNRYTLNSVAGVSILMVSSFYYLIKRTKPILIISAVLLFLSVFTHLLSTSHFVEYYQEQNDFWWQLSWRAPDIKDGTVFTPVGLNVLDYFHIFPQINLIYRPNSKQLAINSQILNSTTIKEILIRHQEKEINLRGIIFKRNYQNLLVVSVGGDSCLHVWDESNPWLAINHNPIISLVAPLSNPFTIDTKSPAHIPPANIFGKEPAHRWCYYYQKASLAKQGGDWETIISLGKELNTQKLHPLDVSEWMPFFEGYSIAGNHEEAEGIALRMKSDMTTVQLICKSFPDAKPQWYQHVNDDTYGFMKQTLCGL